jgi:hypothetical protein
MGLEMLSAEIKGKLLLFSPLFQLAKRALFNLQTHLMEVFSPN